ncbi:hypothetical protein [Ammonifex degensii]|nr:hypothetical protein [Ammonifex degensii]
MTNLDIQCAELGYQLAGIKDMGERILNAALTVLEEQGPYAMFLYVKARHKDVADQFNRCCAQFLKKIFERRFSGNDTVLDVLDMVKSLAGNLDDLLFACDLLRIALSYARYHLKVKEGGTS